MNPSVNICSEHMPFEAYCLRRRAALACTVLVATAAIAGCAVFQPDPPEVVVKKRAQAYWDARIARKPADAYALLTPAYRQVRTVQQYVGQVGVAAGVRSASVYSTECQAERCVVRMELQASPPVPQVKLGTVAMYVNEVWLLDGGNWYLHLAP